MLQAGIEEAQAVQLLVTILAQGIPTVAIGAFVFGDILGPGVQGPMRRGIGEVQEERRAVVMRLINHANGFVADGIGVIKVSGIIGYELAVFDQRVGMEEAAGAGQGAEEAIEAALSRYGMFGSAGTPAFRLARRQESADVPLARHHGAVASALQHFGDGHGVIAQVALIGASAIIAHHVADAGLVRMQAGQQGGARWAAAGEAVHLRKARAVRGEAVEIGRVDLGAVAADIGIAEIIGENEYDVWVDSWELFLFTTEVTAF